jgi:hypothetical protein
MQERDYIYIYIYIISLLQYMLIIQQGALRGEDHAALLPREAARRGAAGQLARLHRCRHRLGRTAAATSCPRSLSACLVCPRIQSVRGASLSRLLGSERLTMLSLCAMPSVHRDRSARGVYTVVWARGVCGALLSESGRRISHRGSAGGRNEAEKCPCISAYD